MKVKLRTLLYSGALAAACALNAAGPEDNVAEEVVWMIGDQPIWRSEVEDLWTQMKQERVNIVGDPYCFVPERIALERIYLHQADIDTIEVPPGRVMAQVDMQINEWMAQAGSREALEIYMHKSLPELRRYMTESMTNRFRMSEVQKNLVSKVKLTPSQVRRYFDRLPADSIPYIPTQVEVQIMTLNPAISREETDAVKNRLREMAERVNNGTANFSTLAVMYSEHPSSTNGGEMGLLSRAQMLPEYATAAFNLNDPKKASAVIETEDGFHIIQLIEKRGERVNTRQILLKPRVDDKDLDAARMRLDSIRADILDGNFTFDEATEVLSQDKDTRNNHGLMSQTTVSGGNTSLFQMSELPAEVARAVAELKPGQISPAFFMKDPKNGLDKVAIVKLKDRIEAHRANLTSDYQLIRDMATEAEQERILTDWVDKKIANTYIRIEPGWQDCPDWKHNWMKK